MGGLAKSPLAGLAALGLGGLGPANTGGLNPAGTYLKKFKRKNSFIDKIRLRLNTFYKFFFIYLIKWYCV